MFTSESLSLFRVLSPSFIFSCTTIASIFAYLNALLVTAVHVKMKLGDNTLNMTITSFNERPLLVMTNLQIKN